MGFMVVPREPLGCLDHLEKLEAVALVVVQSFIGPPGPSGHDDIIGPWFSRPHRQTWTCKGVWDTGFI